MREKVSRFRSKQVRYFHCLNLFQQVNIGCICLNVSGQYLGSFLSKRRQRLCRNGSGEGRRREIPLLVHTFCINHCGRIVQIRDEVSVEKPIAYSNSYSKARQFTAVYSRLQQILAVSDCQLRKSKSLVTYCLTKLYLSSPSRTRTSNLAVNRKHSENCRKAQKSIVFSILASFLIFARVRILSRFFAFYRGISSAKRYKTVVSYKEDIEVRLHGNEGGIKLQRDTLSCIIKRFYGNDH
jgi:hypothetical protein